MSDHQGPGVHRGVWDRWCCCATLFLQGRGHSSGEELHHLSGIIHEHCLPVTTFKVNLKTHFFRQAFVPTATCFIFVCVCVCACVRACVRTCVCVSWRQGWGLGEMELWVGSTIMIHFLYILLFLIWHMYLYIIHC